MTVEQKQPVPWHKGTGATGMRCRRILRQWEAGKREALLPLSVLEEEEVPSVGERIVILNSPVRGIPFLIAKIKLLTLSELTPSHFHDMGVDKSEYLRMWDECNPKRLAESDPEIMLLWLRAEC